LESLGKQGYSFPSGGLQWLYKGVLVDEILVEMSEGWNRYADELPTGKKFEGLIRC